MTFPEHLESLAAYSSGVIYARASNGESRASSNYNYRPVSDEIKRRVCT